MRNFTKIVLSLVMAFGLLGGVNSVSARTVKTLGSPITFEDALVATEPVVLVQSSSVLCGPTSPSDNAMTFKNVSEIDDFAYTIHFEEDGTSGKYFMALYDQAATPNFKGYLNGSGWSHVYLSNIDKSGTKGEEQDGALWTITQSGEKLYAIRNVGVAEGNYNFNSPNDKSTEVDRTLQGYMGITTSGYWANHIQFFNTSGPTWQFYTLNTTVLPDEDPKVFAWSDLQFGSNTTHDDATGLITDSQSWAQYWASSAYWNIPSEYHDWSGYRYLVVCATRNASDHEGAVYITDGTNTMRGDDYKSAKKNPSDENATNYPSPADGNMFINTWQNQHVAIIDLQWVANNDKFEDGTACPHVDITNVTSFGISASNDGIYINCAYLTNTKPATNGDYTRDIAAFDKFGTICLPYNAVCSGADIYEIAGKSASGISLSKVNGIMEAGKPYFYNTLESHIGYWNGSGTSFKDEEKVYFFKAGYATEASPVDNNGLVGTFSSTTAPTGADYYVLSNNKLYNVDSSVTVGANKAYVDISAISPSSARGVVELDFNEPTGIETVANSQDMNVNNKFFNLAGQRVAQPTKGLYIVNGKKVLVK